MADGTRGGTVGTVGIGVVDWIGRGAGVCNWDVTAACGRAGIAAVARVGAVRLPEGEIIRELKLGDGATTEPGSRAGGIGDGAPEGTEFDIVARLGRGGGAIVLVA
jgi:hypothetical protein